MRPTNYLATFRISGRGIAIKQWWMDSEGRGEWRPIMHREGEHAEDPPEFPVETQPRRPRR